MRATIACLLLLSIPFTTTTNAMESAPSIELPKPVSTGDVPVEQALDKRRSVRDFSRKALALSDVSQLLWAAQGITSRRGFRTAPSAGALYPLELYLIAGNVDGLEPGVYRYRPKSHELVPGVSDDRRKALAAAALDQSWVRRAPAVLVIAAVYERTRKKYGQRTGRYVHIEVGGAAQNVYLQSEALDLATVFVGAFDDQAVSEALELPHDHEPLGLMPVGHER